MYGQLKAWYEMTGIYIRCEIVEIYMMYEMV